MFALPPPDENNDENNDDNNNDNNNYRVWQGSARHPPDSTRAAKGTRMSKLLTGALAGSAGGALLLDEARTFTLRNSKASVTGGSIVAVDQAVATLGVGTASITGATAVAADPARAHKLPANTVLDVTRTSITGAAPTCTVTPETAAISSSPVVVTATITLPKSPTACCVNSAKLGSVNLTNLMVTPTQD